METRIQRYKNYRAELIKEGSEDIKISEKPMSTTALPLQEVMSMNDDLNEKYYIRQRRKKIIQYSIIVLAILIVTVGLIVTGYFVFRG